MNPTMKPHYKPLATALAAALQLAAIAAVPVAWTNSPGMPPYPIKTIPHGSTVDLAVTLRGYTTPPIADGADVRLWYQTNGMGSAWWSAPATFDGSTITASFGPAQDCGADRVSLFFGAPSNVFASAVLRLTHSPGFAPASLPPPPGVAMQPWVAEQLAALAMATTNYTNQTLADFASTGKVAYAAASSDAEVANRLIDSNGQNYTADDFATKVKTTSCAWSAYCDTMFSHPFALSQVSPTTWRFFPVGGRRLGAPTITLNRVGGQGNDGFWELSYGAATSIEYIPGTNSAPASAMQLEFAIVGLEPSGGAWTNSWTVSRTNNVSTSVAYLDDVPTNLSQLENDVPYATRGDVSSAIPPAITSIVTKSYVEDLGISSEVDETDPVWSAEKSGYATVDALGTVDDTARAAQGTANGLSGRVAALETWAVGDETALSVTDAGTSNATLRISYTNRVMYSSATERTNTVNEAKAYTDRKAADVVSAVDAALATKADRAWGTTTSGGAPSPEDTLYVEKRKVTITGGGNYAYLASSTGGYWVLSVSLGSEWTMQALADAQNPTNPATASFIDADGNAAWTVTSTGTRVAFAMKGEQYIYVEDVGGNDVVTITYPITADDHPTCLYSPECIAGEAMTEASAANWPDHIALVEWSGHSGEWVCRVTMNGRPGRGFFAAKYIKTGTVYTKYEKPLGIQTVVIGRDEYRVHVETMNGKKVMVLEDL